MNKWEYGWVCMSVWDGDKETDHFEYVCVKGDYAPKASGLFLSWKALVSLMTWGVT